MPRAKRCPGGIDIYFGAATGWGCGFDEERFGRSGVGVGAGPSS